MTAIGLERLEGSMEQRFEVAYGRGHVVEAHIASVRRRGALTCWTRLADEDYDAIVATALATMDPADLRAVADELDG